MTPKTVAAPPELEASFAQAEAVVSRYFADRHEQPEHGTIEISGERYVLVRAAALSVEFFGLVHDLYGPGREREADEFSRNLLFDLAHAIGRSDARKFQQHTGIDDPVALLCAGPVHFAHTGWARVEILSGKPVAGRDYSLVYDHPYSFESDAWLRAGERREFPACIMNAGYSSGWCEACFGVELVATEVLCRARGDASCRFVMAHPAEIERHLAAYRAGAPRPLMPVAGDAIPDFFSRKRAEEELRRAHADLERRVAERTSELQASHDRLKDEIERRQQAEKRLLQTERLEAVGRLAGGIAHDFNNLMAVILGNCALLQRRLAHAPDEADFRPFVDEIREAGERAASLTRQLLTFSRAEARGRGPLDLNRVVANLGRMLERVLGDDVELSTQLAPDLAQVLGDTGQLEQVVMNLVVNARDAMPGGGSLVLETSNVTLDAARAFELGVLEAGAYVLLSVRDRGTGIDDATLAQIFDPFFTTKEAGKGTGLGLSTVYGIVKHAGGAIAVSSAKGRGTTFDIYLPAAPAEEASEGYASEKRLPIADLPSGAGTVLLVEDEPRLRAVLGEILAQLGYQVVLAAGGAEALESVRGHAGGIDVVLTDVSMPGMSGIELARRLAAARPETKVLFMSGLVDPAELARNGLAGAMILAKPFTPQALQQRLADLMGR